MSAMMSQITDGVSIGCSTFVHAKIKENIKAPRHWPLWGESTGDQWIPPHKGPVTRKMFPFDDVILATAVAFYSSRHNYGTTLTDEPLL